jgi:hypothetical protein
MDNYFRLKNREEVEKFDQFLINYYESKKTFRFHGYLNLTKWFDYCLSNKDYGGKIFISILDIKLNLIFLDFEMTQAINTWESNFNKIPSKKISIIDNKNYFNPSLNILENYSNFVLRYRALWDKIMGLIILDFAPEKYDNFRRSKSRKKQFRKLIDSSYHSLAIDIDRLFELIESFDNDYRTPEAHGTGTLRKWILNPSNFTEFEIENPYYKLNLDYWNGIIYIISEIDNKILKSCV